MKLILNQCFPLQTTSIQPNDLKKKDVEFALFLATDVLTSPETRQFTIQFLETAFQQKALTAEKWANHVLQLTRTHDVKTVPSFALLQFTNPVQLWMYGQCQVVHIHADKTFEVLKPNLPNPWLESAHLTELNSHWVLCRSDSGLIEPIADSLKKALAQTQYSLEVFFYNLNFPLAKKQAVTVVRVEAIVDLDAPNEHSEVRAHLTQMAIQARPDTKALIQQFLNKKEVEQEFWTGKVKKVDYQAVLSDLELKKKELEEKKKKNSLLLSERQMDLTKFKSDLVSKNAEITELQNQIKALNDEISNFASIRENAMITQKKLDKVQEEKQMLQKTKEYIAKDLLNKSDDLAQLQKEKEQLQSVTHYDLLSKQLRDTKLQLEKVQKEKQALQKTNEDTVKDLLDKSNDLAWLQKGKDTLQQVHNQAVTRYDLLSKQCKDAQSKLSNLQKEKDALQQVHNQSVTEKNTLFQQLKTAQSNLSNLQTEKDKLQSAHNQYVTQNEALFQIAQAEIKRLQRLLELKEEAAKQPPKPIIEKPIIIPKPVIKTQLPFEPEMILVEGGTFKMGGQVTLSNFMIGKYPITQAQWKAVMGNNPSHFKGDDLPVEQVSWDDAQDFISKLNDKTGKTYRLPTEAQWEFAARGGNKSKGYDYSGSNNLDEVGWFENNSDWKTHLVGKKAANELLVHDMSGNVWEWCSDWYGSYSSAAVSNPTGATEGTYRVLRGGSWRNDAESCRVAYRSYGSSSRRDLYCGFRVVSFPWFGKKKLF